MQIFRDDIVGDFDLDVRGLFVDRWTQAGCEGSVVLMRLLDTRRTIIMTKLSEYFEIVDK